MMEENLQFTVSAIRRWASDEIDKLIYDGTRPVSACATVDAAAREAAIALGNRIAHAAQIERIESLADYLSRCLSASARGHE
jgi:hypothetical protein